MTNEEAIKDIKENILPIVGGKSLLMAIAALEGKDTNVPTNSALDHIHNVVRDDAYRRGYEQGKADANCPEIPDSWIPVSERLPEEKINPNTQDFEEVLCSTTFGDVRAYRFGTPCGWKKPHFWHGPGMMDEYVLAWMPLPEPYKEGEK